MEIDAAVLRSLAEQVASRAVPGRASLVAIDGFGGAGKSVLACGLRRVVADARIVEADDFWRPSPERPGRERVIAEPGCDYDHARLAREVLEPLSAGRDAVAVLAPLLDRAHRIVVTNADSSRSLDARAIVERLVASGFEAERVRAVPDPRQALLEARAQLARDDLLCVAGSMYMAGVARETLTGDADGARHTA